MTLATILCFNIPIPNEIKAAAAEKGIKVEHFNVIYKLVDRLKDLLSEKIPITEELRLLGEGHVLQEFRVPDAGKKRQPIAGTLIDSGFFDK